MRKYARTRTLLVLALLATCLVASSLLASQRLGTKDNGVGAKDLTGTWHLTAVLNGQLAHAMSTVISDGTFIHTGAAKFNVNAHGIWKKLDARTYVEQNREYVYDQDGKLFLFADTTETIEMSEDGMSTVGEAVTELKTIDTGTVVDVVEFTIHGTRVVFDF